MTTTGDDLDFDLSAWEAPPAPSGIADGVLARMRVPAAPAADDAQGETPEVRRRSYAIAAAALACLAAGTATYVLTRPKDPSGPVASTQAHAAPVAVAPAPVAVAPAPAAATSVGAAPAPAPRPAPPPTVAATEKSLTREMISKAMASIKLQVAQCSGASTKSGKVKVTIKVRPDGKVGAFGVEETFDPAVSSCIVDVLKKLQFPVTDEGGTFSYPFVFPSSLDIALASPHGNVHPDALGDPNDQVEMHSCDAKAASDRGNQQTSLGEFDDALASYEDAMKCKGSDAQLRKLAFMSACNAKNVDKAHQYYGQLTAADQKRLVVLCTRNGIDPKVVAPANCDSQELKDRGMEHINMGEHADAVRDFESAYRCKIDPTLPMIIATEACAAGDVAKAKSWYGRLAQPDQAKVAAACGQSGVTITASATAAATGSGYLEVGSSPQGAKILVDGVDTGLTTPTSGHKLPLKVGAHKVTLVMGEERFTWPVTIQADGVLILHKDLQ